MIRAKKSLGQNFLTDRNILETIVGVTPINNKIILEIGPGTGNLTSFILRNNPKKVFVVEKGLRIAQMVVCPIIKVHLEEVNEFNNTDRGEGGFGSTGAK